jgi:hypothetical protein
MAKVGGFRQLMAAVLLLAVRDAQQTDPHIAAPARRWLANQGGELAELLEIDPSCVVSWLVHLDPLPWQQLPLSDGRPGPFEDSTAELMVAPFKRPTR